MLRIATLLIASWMVAASPALAAQRRTDVVRAIDRVSGAVVSVQITKKVRQANSIFDWFFKDFSSLPENERPAGQGSGVIIDPSGLVVTNYHVIQGAHRISLELASGEMFDADVVGTAPDHDLAVLRASGSRKLTFVPMGRSDDLMIGETVIAIGNPFGLSHTVTTGVVSAMHRTIRAENRVYTDFIQTDASINPGNSGGPLLNIQGDLIGVNTAIYGRAQGIGFAIPIDKAKRIVDDLLKYGEVRRPYYGFEMQPLTAKLARAFRLRDNRGALVSEIDPQGPSANILREGDVIRVIGRQRVADYQTAKTRFADFTVGSNVSVRILRDGKQRTVKLEAGAMEHDDALRRVRSRLGLSLKELKASDATRYDVKPRTLAVASVARGSAADQVGIRQGDLIRAVNSERVIGLRAFGKAMARHYWRGRVQLLVQRGRAWQEIAFRF